MSGRKSSKKKLLKNARVMFISCIALLVILTLFGGLFLIKSFNSNFKLVDRTKKVEKYKNKVSEGAETVGWIKVQGTNIDYPVIYAPEVELESIVDDFAWTEVDFDKLNNITYISGHNIKNLSANPIITDSSHTRFEQLMSFVYYDFAKDNQYFEYTIGNKNYMFKIYSVMFIPHSDLDLYNSVSYTKKEMKDYINLTKSSSIYDYRVDVNNNDKIVSLVTCSRMFDDKSFVVTGRLLRDSEKVKVTNIFRTKNYELIDNALKGGSLNEDA